MSVSEVIVALGAWLVISLAIAIIYSLIRSTVTMYQAEGAPPIPNVPAPWPRRYAGCITCEAAEATSRLAMIRHQNADHDDGVQW